MTPLTAFAGWQKEGDTYAYYEEPDTLLLLPSPDLREGLESIAPLSLNV